MVWYKLLASSITTSGKLFRFTGPCRLPAAFAQEGSNLKKDHMTLQSACSVGLNSYSLQAFLLQLKPFAYG